MPTGTPIKIAHNNPNPIRFKLGKLISITSPDVIKSINLVNVGCGAKSAKAIISGLLAIILPPASHRIKAQAIPKKGGHILVTKLFLKTSDNKVSTFLSPASKILFKLLV